MNPAILFEPDGYALDGPKLMGRQAAGNGFLRAAVKGRSDGPLVAYTPSRASGEAFRALVRQIDPTAQTMWLPANRLELMDQLGTLYRPDHAIGQSALARLRVGIDRYSLCGVTHTLASTLAMDTIANLLTAPLAPWDAVVCTSQAALGVIETVLAAQADYLQWRVGRPPGPRYPQLPVIPLGVHCEDFESSEQARAQARAALDLADDEVAVLFAGRLSPHAKAHPHAMYVALQAAAQRTGRKVTLIQAGRFSNAAVEATFRAAVELYCPDVRAVFVIDAGDATLYRQCWIGADLFLSLSDSIQETFGLTPVEAMAAGLPVVVTDWNGYKDTVRDGVDGFRIPTWAPEPGGGERIGRDFELAATNYDHYLSRTGTAVAVDMRSLVDRLTDLVLDPDLRRRLGDSARERARTVFDWTVVYRQYQALWAELSAIRLRARGDPALAAWLAAAPKVAPSRLDPFMAFGHYPSAWISADTHAARRPGATAESYQALIEHPFWSNWTSAPDLVGRLLDLMGEEGRSVAHLADAMAIPVDQAIELVARLAKMDLVQLSTGGVPDPA